MSKKANKLTRARLMLQQRLVYVCMFGLKLDFLFTRKSRFNLHTRYFFSIILLDPTRVSLSYEH